ncbi:MAG: hypothetical protein ACTHK8_04060 [Ginsengibacter sp.]
MDSYLSKIDYNFWEISMTLPAELERIINSDFVTDNDCIVLKEVGDISTNPKFNTSLKKCEWEDSQTHFHPDMYIDTDNEIEYLQLALESGKRLAKRLNTEFPDKDFRISISFNKTTIVDNEVENYGSSTVRFYQVRQDCENIMRTENLDDFKSDAVLEIEKLQATKGLAKNWLT